MTIRILTLRNGTEVPEPVARTVMLALHLLEDENPAALYEAVQLARDPSHVLFGNTGQVLAKLGLLQGSKLPQAVRDVILAAAEGDDLSLRLASPYGPEGAAG